MKKHFCIPLLMVALLALFSACSKDELSPNAQNPDLVTGDSYVTVSGSGEVALRDKLEGGGDDKEGFCPTSCECAYEIVKVDIVTPSGTPEYGLEFFSTENCGSGMCSLFRGHYYTLGDCGPGPTATCNNYLPSVPSPLMPFECAVEPNRRFMFNFDGFAYTGSCASATDFTRWEITYRIHCKPTSSTTSCNSLPASHFSTPEITMRGGGGINTNQDTIRLTGCGCQPAIDRPCTTPLPNVFIQCATGYKGFCLVDANGVQLSQSPLFLNTSIYWQAPSQFECFQGECADLERGPQPFPSPGTVMRFTIRRGDCFREYTLTFPNC